MVAYNVGSLLGLIINYILVSMRYYCNFINFYITRFHCKVE